MACSASSDASIGAPSSRCVGDSAESLNSGSETCDPEDDHELVDESSDQDENGFVSEEGEETPWQVENVT